MTEPVRGRRSVGGSVAQRCETPAAFSSLPDVAETRCFFPAFGLKRRPPQEARLLLRALVRFSRIRPDLR